MTQPVSGLQNRLAGETSPYLRQHAANPVDWYPWGAAALERARRDGKPILLSIGYAACHWCHVMAHESFEDPAIAALMNELFVNIKVDREERPDLDRLYQLAQQMLTGRGGGWPLTMFLMPEDQRPFFGGTYFPPQPRHGLPGFPQLLQHVADYFREHPDELRQPADAVVRALQKLQQGGTDVPLDRAPLRNCRAQLERSFDGRWGGFGGAPRFPHPPFIDRLLRDWHASAGDATPDLQALYMASLTLTRMAEGGLFDQLAGGFCRYSVDERWEIPHFEKMLYDNAQLLPIYASAALATGEALFRDVALRTADWMLAEMRAPAGAFYASLDADSEGHEGRFYVWDREAVQSLLTPREFAVVAAHHGLDQPPNFEGQWHLIVHTTLAALSPDIAGDDAATLLASARRKLLAARSQRVRPATDQKVLTSWNALAIRGLAIAARTLQRPDYAVVATEALQFLRRHHWRNGRLRVTSADSEARLNAYLDDYVFLADAILELAAVRFDAAELAFGVELLEVVLAHFAAADGGFYFTSDDHEQLICRPRTFSDDALPSGNAIAALALQRYGLLLGEERYLHAAEATLRAAAESLQQQPQQHAAMLVALEEWLTPPQLVILRGDTAAIEQWRTQLATVYAPQRLVFAIPGDATALPPALQSKPPSAAATGYLCRGNVCSAPMESLEALIAALNSPT
jgi:hypothetical protein